MFIHSQFRQGRNRQDTLLLRPVPVGHEQLGLYSYCVKGTLTANFVFDFYALMS